MSDDHDRRLESLNDLGARLEKGREKAGLNPPPARRAATGHAGQALNAAIEFVVSTLVGAGLGYMIGSWAGSKTIGLVLGLVVGFAAGLRGIFRIMMAENAEDKKEQGGNGRNTD